MAVSQPPPVEDNSRIRKKKVVGSQAGWGCDVKRMVAVKRLQQACVISSLLLSWVAYHRHQHSGMLT